MEFISLSEVLCNIAERVQLHPRFPCSNTRIGKISLAAADEFWYAKKKNHLFSDGYSIDEEIEWARKIGVAALYLNNIILDSSNKQLQWAEFDGNRRVNVSEDLIKKEALGMLEHTIGWGNRLEEKYNNHFRNSINQGDEVLMLPVPIFPDEGLTRDEEIFRLMAIGCDIINLMTCLEENDIEHSLVAQAAPASEPMTPAAMPPAEAPVTPATSPAVKGVTTAQIVEAFGHLVSINLGKAMTDKALWTKDARITNGTRGGKHKALWNPVILATALHERSSTPMMKLNQAFNTFKFLADWREEWNRFSAM